MLIINLALRGGGLKFQSFSTTKRVDIKLIGHLWLIDPTCFARGSGNVLFKKLIYKPEYSSAIQCCNSNYFSAMYPLSF